MGGGISLKMRWKVMLSIDIFYRKVFTTINFLVMLSYI